MSFSFYNSLIVLSISFVWAHRPDKIRKIDDTIRGTQMETLALVEKWTEEIGDRLAQLSVTMTRPEEVKNTFRPLQNHLHAIDGVMLTEQVASNIREFMDKKVEAVKRIADYAEFLSFHWRNDSSPIEETREKYFYYDVDNIESSSEETEFSLTDYVFDLECHWWCFQMNKSNIPNNLFTKQVRKELFSKRNPYENESNYCNCDNLSNVLCKNDTYTALPLEYNKHFDTKVNLDVSAIKVATNIYEREDEVLEGIRWSEALDLVFKINYLHDPDLVWQYFASPAGYMRHYPAIQWSPERYYQTYDFRTRSWYTEAMTSPKDIIILLDQSGSMKGKRRKLSHQIVNDILDTLNDNDFVNIYTFNNVTNPLVDCFNDTLFQANEENLRLLRENLPVYLIDNVANITTAFEMAFQVLAEFRDTNLSANCNQAIMLITEGLDYEYDVSIFNTSNWMKDFPVRIFTYLLSNEKEDEKQMEFIACSNMGYYVNVTQEPDIREKVLHYLKVMSRPINFCADNKQSPIWSYLYVDLADRRLSNWLWHKFEGIRQREVYLDHVKRRVDRLQLSHNTLNHMLLQESHEYEKYEEQEKYRYMTTVSLPVYGTRDDVFHLAGVAGVDVPIDFFKARIPHDLIGVNGYAFIITNNGYILMHPEHRTEFDYILKPTFNRVDILETEILDDINEPRIFGDAIVQLRESMLKRRGKQATLKMKYTLDDMKRIVRATRHYFYTDIGPFTLCIVLPDQYGNLKINRTGTTSKPIDISATQIHQPDWTVHPDWIYCKNCPTEQETPHEKVVYARYHSAFRTQLYYDLMYDFDKTEWFKHKFSNANRFIEEYHVHKVFLSTTSGLTRWKTFSTVMYQNIYGEADAANDRSIDEDWYQRTVEENYKNEEIFIYSVPFEISGYENNTMIKATKAIFVEKNGQKTPVAVTGFEFNHQAMNSIYKNITTTHVNTVKDANMSCGLDYLKCFILDNNAYILLSDEMEYTGRFIGDIRPDIMYYLVHENVFEYTRMFDYQATCQFVPPEAPNPKNMSCPKSTPAPKRNKSSKNLSIFQNLFRNIFDIIQWIINMIFLSVGYGLSSSDQILKEETKVFENLQVKKTVPTPCDREMWLFTMRDDFRASFYKNDSSKFSCNWPYVLKKIPKSNLLFLAIYGKCSMTTTNTYTQSPEPTQIHYYDKDNEISLPCYIATMNKYTRDPYMKCYNRDKREDPLNTNDTYYCGHTWD